MKKPTRKKDSLKEKNIPDKESIHKKKFPVEFIYHGRNITIRKKKDEYSLTIDNEKIPVIRTDNLGFIAAPHAPMLSHQSLEELAIYLTDRVINMRCDFPTLQLLKVLSK